MFASLLAPLLETLRTHFSLGKSRVETLARLCQVVLSSANMTFAPAPQAARWYWQRCQGAPGRTALRAVPRPA